jgi:hypothetical protein
MDQLQNHISEADTAFDREMGEEAGQKRQAGIVNYS